MRGLRPDAQGLEGGTRPGRRRPEARATPPRMRALWPHAEVVEVETVAGGPRRTRLLALAYRVVMRRAPGLYGLAYDALGRLPRLAAFFQRLGAPATARALRPVLRRHRPDLAVCTYPVTTGGLALLRRRGGGAPPRPRAGGPPPPPRRGPPRPGRAPFLDRAGGGREGGDAGGGARRRPP